MRLCTTNLLLLLAGCASFEGKTSPVTPQRPTFSSDTSTTAEGTFEFEAGGVIDPGDSVDTPLAVKWGAGPRTELFAGWSPYQMVGLPGPDADGVSDLQLGVRHRVVQAQGPWPSVALQWITKLPTGDQSQGLSNGEIDFRAAGIVTKQFEQLTATGFYQASILGNPTGGTDLEHLIALAGGTSVAERWGVFAELASVLNHESNIENYFATAGTTFAVSQSFAFDAGAVVGLNDEAPDFQILFGFTTNLGARPLLALTSTY